MKQLLKKVLISIALIILEAQAKTPKLTIIIVVDQLCPHYIEKFKPYLNGGISFLAKNGINYKNTFFQHCPTTTAPGHTMLSTGTYANYHGIVGNKWYDKNNKKTTSDQDDTPNSAVIKPDGSAYNYGKSAKNTLVDGLSDQLVMHSYPHAKNSVWSLSLKSRAAIATATHLGKAIWFDDKTGNFTSSKAYFKQLPKWITDFNEKQKTCDIVTGIKSMTWKPFFTTKEPYKYALNDNFMFSDIKKSVLNETINITEILLRKNNDAYTETPDANKNLIELAKACINKNLIQNNDSERLFMWLCLSSLDKLGHKVGPHAKDFIDLLYHMDSHIDDLLKFVYKKIDKKDVLIVLTADHGVQPIPQLLSGMGLDISRLYYDQDIIDNMNKIIKDKYQINNLVYKLRSPQFYFDQKEFNKLNKKSQKQIIQDLKNYLLTLPGIRNAWGFDELKNLNCDSCDTDAFLKNQLYRGRSGQLFFSAAPYTVIDKHKTGTSHGSQYAYDRQVPLILYQAGQFEKKHIYQNVNTTQLSVTLANILGVPRPSAAVDNVLPGLFKTS